MLITKVFNASPRCHILVVGVLFLFALSIPSLGVDYTKINLGFETEIRDRNNNLLINKKIGIRISILDGALDGPVRYIETHTPTTNPKGLVNVLIGRGSDVSGNIQGIEWSEGLYYLKVETDLNGDGDYTLSGINQLQSLPFNLVNQGNEKETVTKAYVDALEARIRTLEMTILKPTDSEGNVYKIVKLGNQIWMAENLKTTFFNDGSPIPHVTNNADWNNLTTPAYCWYNNEQLNYGDEYGVLYNWYAVNTAKLCPAGWHVPTDTEWSVLTSFLASSEHTEQTENDTLNNKGILKPGTNNNEFLIIPGGYRTYIGVFGHVDEFGMWWSSSEYSTNYAWYLSLNSKSNDLNRNFFLKKNGFYIRCIRD